MKLTLFIMGLLFSAASQAQTYAPYSGNKAKTTTASKPAPTKSKTPKATVSEKITIKEEIEPVADFEELMTKAAEQLHQKDFLKSESFYTQALEVSTEKNAWRAWLSRATLYAIMKEHKKAINDLSSAIGNKGTPKTQLAVIYATRARMYSVNRNMGLACKDIAKAKALGVSERLISDIDCE